MSEKSHCLSYQSNPISNSEHLENSKANIAQTTVQTCPEVNVKDCRVRMRFRSDAVPDLEHDIALMLLDIFRNRPDKE